MHIKIRMCLFSWSLRCILDNLNDSAPSTTPAFVSVNNETSSWYGEGCPSESNLNECCPQTLRVINQFIRVSESASGKNY